MPLTACSASWARCLSGMKPTPERRCEARLPAAANSARTTTGRDGRGGCGQQAAHAGQAVAGHACGNRAGSGSGSSCWLAGEHPPARRKAYARAVPKPCGAGKMEELCGSSTARAGRRDGAAAVRRGRNGSISARHALTRHDAHHHGALHHQTEEAQHVGVVEPAHQLGLVPERGPVALHLQRRRGGRHAGWAPWHVRGQQRATQRAEQAAEAAGE